MAEMAQKFIGALFLVIPLIWFVIWIYSKQSGGTGLRGIKGKKRGVMRVMNNLPLGPKKSVSVVNIAGEYLVLGVSSDQVSYLTKIDNPDTVDRLEDAFTDNDSVGNGFKKLLTNKGSLKSSGLKKSFSNILNPFAALNLKKKEAKEASAKAPAPKVKRDPAQAVKKSEVEGVKALLRNTGKAMTEKKKAASGPALSEHA